MVQMSKTYSDQRQHLKKPDANLHQHLVHYSNKTLLYKLIIMKKFQSIDKPNTCIFIYYIGA